MSGPDIFAGNLPPGPCADMVVYRISNSNFDVGDLVQGVVSSLMLLYMLLHLPIYITKLKSLHSPIRAYLLGVVGIAVLFSVGRLLIIMLNSAADVYGLIYGLELIPRFVCFFAEVTVLLFMMSSAGVTETADSQIQEKLLPPSTTFTYKPTSIWRIILWSFLISGIDVVVEGVLLRVYIAGEHPPCALPIQIKWLLHSIFLTLVYLFVLIVPFLGGRFTSWSVRPSFRRYVFFMCFVHFLRFIGMALFIGNRDAGICIVDITEIIYESFFIVVFYLTYLWRFFSIKSYRASTSFTDQLYHRMMAAGYIDSSDPEGSQFLRRHPSLTSVLRGRGSGGGSSYGAGYDVVGTDVFKDQFEYSGRSGSVPPNFGPPLADASGYNTDVSGSVEYQSIPDDTRRHMYVAPVSFRRSDVSETGSDIFGTSSANQSSLPIASHSNNQVSNIPGTRRVTRPRGSPSTGSLIGRLPGVDGRSSQPRSQSLLSEDSATGGPYP